MIKSLIQTFQQMDRVRKRYLALTISVFLIFAFILASTSIRQFDKINQIHAVHTREQIITIKKQFLEDSVNNSIRFINETKAIHESLISGRVEQLLIFLKEHADHSDIETLIAYLSSDTMSEDLVISVEQPDGTLIYESSTARRLPASSTKNDYLRVEMIEIQQHHIVIGALNETIKRHVEAMLRERLYADVYFDDAYIWVNEVIDYAGGDDYARRLIHPNLRDTEGLLLSTDMEDINGGKPYLEELEGVKADGELFFTYYFKKLTTDKIEKKITFAKLYEPYDWIVAMGIYYDNLEAYIEQASEASKKDRQAALLLIWVVSLALILSGIVIFLWAERMYYQRSAGALKIEVDTDLLTGAGSRRAALKALSYAFKAFKTSGGLYSLMLIDLDDFKLINDTYGHETGDQVLIRVVDSINRVIREEDRIYRWGGEEFIVFSRGVSQNHLDPMMDKILQAVEQSEYDKDGQTIRITISIGASCFESSDKSYDEALKRADDALYQSKRSGKNRGTTNFK